jgi:hypothetical protein
MQYRVSGGIPAGSGTQAVTGTLTLGNPTIVEIDPTVFTYGTVSPVNAVALNYLQAAGPGLPAGDLTGTGFTSAVFSDNGTGTITLLLS